MEDEKKEVDINKQLSEIDLYRKAEAACKKAGKERYTKPHIVGDKLCFSVHDPAVKAAVHEFAKASVYYGQDVETVEKDCNDILEKISSPFSGGER